MLSAVLNKKDKQLKNIRISQIVRNPAQPRKFFDAIALAELSASIKEYGILNPLSVKKVPAGGGFELIAGERRLRAAKLAGLVEVPCIIMQATREDSSVLAIIENIQRRDLDFFEEAESYKILIETFGLTQEEAAKKLGKTQSAVANKLRILRLSKENIDMIRESDLTERHARSILRIEKEEDRLAATVHIIKNQFNVSRAEEYIDGLLTEKKVKSKGTILALIKDVRFFLNTLDKAVKTMQNSGVVANMEKEESDESMTLTIVIPKAKVIR